MTTDDDPPQCLIFAGPNGAGKSTAAGVLLPRHFAFVNADEVAKTLPGYPSPRIDREAARIVLDQLDDLVGRRVDFGFETTLAGKTFAARVVRMRESGYFVRLVFLWAPSPEFSIERVAARVRSGGHAIPEETIRRRWGAGLRNFSRLYVPIVDRWEAFENTTSEGLRIIAEGQGGGAVLVRRPEVWERMIAGGQE